jgi:Flp pilus assembly pilin Flp
MDIMYEHLKQIISQTLRTVEALVTATSRTAGDTSTDESGSVALEYALLVSGLGGAIAGPVSYLGHDLVSLFERVELTLCQHLMSHCILWGG